VPLADRTRRGDAGQSHRRRLIGAFEELNAFPVLAQSRSRVLALFEGGDPATADVVAIVESDIALAMTVLRLANRAYGPMTGRVETIVDALRVLSPSIVHSTAAGANTFDFFERSASWNGTPTRFRLHAIATQQAADRLAGELAYGARDRLMVSSLLHDLGKLAMVHAYPQYGGSTRYEDRTPTERILAERRELGIDHGLIGGVIARRWGFPMSISRVIERHHTGDAHEETGIVRLADMLAHYALGDPITADELLQAATVVGLGQEELRRLMYELPLPTDTQRPLLVDPNPMSARERDVLGLLAQGMAYRQIAKELGVGVSTVRTHLHSVYGKLDVRDRAQAVLTATQRGWI
jgi:putative nucleotidyltransferase with HDIG domain